MWYLYPGGGLKGADYYWMHSLTRNINQPLPHDWQWWTWQFVRPNHAFLTKRGFVVFNQAWLPPHEKKEVVIKPIPLELEYEQSSCVMHDCFC